MIPVLAILGLLSPLLALALLALAILFRRTRRRLVQLEREARQDPLTGLPNRRGLALHWDSLAQDKALLLIDLVGFKAVNDSHGHIVGDALLDQVAARLAAAVPPPGQLSRWGGDEFVAAVPVDRLARQKQLFANALVMAFDLSASGGPPAVHIDARIGASVGEAELEKAVKAAAIGLVEAKSDI